MTTSRPLPASHRGSGFESTSEKLAKLLMERDILPTS
jgi:hypothetical protein